MASSTEHTESKEALASTELFISQVKSLITNYFFPENLGKSRPNPRKDSLSEFKLNELMVKQHKTSLDEFMLKLDVTRNDLFVALHQDGFEIRLGDTSISTVTFHMREKQICEKEMQIWKAIKENQKAKPQFSSFPLPLPETKFGLEVVHPSCDLGPLAPLALAEIPKLRVMEEPIEVYVTRAITPSNFYLQPVELDIIRYHLLDAMQQLYFSERTAHLTIMGMYDNLVGLLVACLVDSYFESVSGPLWQRGKIVGLVSTNKVRVFLIDSGKEVVVILEYCRLLIKDFGQVPPLAIHCRLAALSPRNREKGWPKKAIGWFKRCFIEQQEKFIILTYRPQAVAMNVEQDDKLDVCLIQRKESVFGRNTRNLNDAFIAFDFACARLLALDSTGHLPWQDKGLHPMQLPQFLQPQNIMPMDIVLYTQIVLRGDFLKDEHKVQEEEELGITWSIFDLPTMDPWQKCQNWLLSRKFEEVVTEESEGEDNEQKDQSMIEGDENELEKAEIKEEKGNKREHSNHELSNSVDEVMKSGSIDENEDEHMNGEEGIINKQPNGIEHDESFKSVSAELEADGSESNEEGVNQSIIELWPEMKLTVATVIESSEVSNSIMTDEDVDMTSETENEDTIEEENHYKDEHIMHDVKNEQRDVEKQERNEKSQITVQSKNQTDNNCEQAEIEEEDKSAKDQLKINNESQIENQELATKMEGKKSEELLEISDKKEAMSYQSSLNLSWPWINLSTKTKDLNKTKTIFTVPEEAIYYIEDK